MHDHRGTAVERWQLTSSEFNTGTRNSNPQKKKRRTTMKQILSNLMNDESGQDLIEYALVAALIALGAVTVLKTLSGNITSTFTAIGTTLTSAV
jgi:pilus assembly protein Flp/PilA